MRPRRLAAVCVSVAAVTAGALPASADVASVPLVGVTLTHSMITDCSPSRGVFDLSSSIGIVGHYGDPGERRLVRTQLAAMRAAGIDSVRFLLWFTTDAGGQTWGVISSAGGGVAEPYRSNLIRFVSDIRAAGFTRLTIAFAAQGANSPFGDYGGDGTFVDDWNPAKLDENWSFIAAVHQLVKPYAPSDTVFDILSEVPPSQYQQPAIISRVDDYIRAIWTRYSDAFGLGDAVISLIAKGGQGPDRLQRLIDTLRSTGRGWPADFEFHTDWTSPSAYEELEAVNQVLNANGLSQPIVVGEASYENAGVANDVARFEADSGRRVAEVFEWFQTTDGGACTSPPYRADAYITALKHEATPPPTPDPLPLLPIPTLHASVTAAGVASLRTETGDTVTALDAGVYRIVVSDRSRHAGFHLDGPGLAFETRNSFTGDVRALFDVGDSEPYGSTFTYRGGTRVRRSFVVH